MHWNSGKITTVFNLGGDKEFYVRIKRDYDTVYYKFLASGVSDIIEFMSQAYNSRVYTYEDKQGLRVVVVQYQDLEIYLKEKE